MLPGSCILFHFYIKPQPRGVDLRQLKVVSYSISTSNHNAYNMHELSCRLYLIPFLHQTTTVFDFVCNIDQLYLIPFLHQTTTLRNCSHKNHKLYLIPFLHQTTTDENNKPILVKLYLIPFLHQTTTIQDPRHPQTGCILFHFYIKPQPFPSQSAGFAVVSYSISTSNHNSVGCILCCLFVVSYSISTSNHNSNAERFNSGQVVSYSISTSNHNTIA